VGDGAALKLGRDCACGGAANRLGEGWKTAGPGLCGAWQRGQFEAAIDDFAIVAFGDPFD
jgi:hypothetical protein